MRVVITGQVGIDKKDFLNRAGEMARDLGWPVEVCHVGKMMYGEAPDVAPGKILDLPLGRLNSLRRSVFKDILSVCQQKPNVIINTHATFRWKHGLFYAFDYDQMKSLNADLYIVLVDNIDAIHWRLVRDGHSDHTLKDLMVWREEEILATELLAHIVRGHGRFFILSRGADDSTVESLLQLMFRPYMRKAYLSFPMSHLVGAGCAAAIAEVEKFRAVMKKYFVCFDPGDLEEKHLCKMAIDAAQAGHRNVEYGPPSRRAVMDTTQLLAIIPDIDGQIYARDFKLIDQSDMIVSLIPALANGSPAISSGVERELQHAHEGAKDVFVIWRPVAPPSPFVTETATKVFRTVEEATNYFVSANLIEQPPGGSLFK